MLAKYESVPSDLAAQIFEACHLLAQTHLKLKETKEAEEFCTKAMKARRRDKTSDSYRNSVMLMAAICEEKGDPITAKGWSGLIGVPECPPALSISIPSSNTSERRGKIPAPYHRPTESISTASTSTVNSKIFDEESILPSDYFGSSTSGRVRHLQTY